MASRPSPAGSQPDLLSLSLHGKGKEPQAVPATPRTILPSDLPSALAGLADSELKKLADALAVEMDRRKLTMTSQPVSPGEVQNQKPKRRASAVDGLVEPSGQAPLAQGKLNAIRAAVKAGVKPTVIARQFGVSLSAIRNALKDQSRQ